MNDERGPHGTARRPQTTGSLPALIADEIRRQLDPNYEHTMPELHAV